MSVPIVDSEKGVTILGAGDVSQAVLTEALQHAPLLVAADGGAARAIEFGLNPTAVIGDLDSLDAKTRAVLPPHIVHPINEQETTDFDKCLRSIRAPFTLAVGFTGARLDHGLAAFSSLVVHSSPPCILIGPQDVAFVAPTEVQLAVSLGTRISLFPMGEVEGSGTGLRWPIDGIEFAPFGRIGTSNEAVSARITLSFSNRRMVVLLPRANLGAVIQALQPTKDAPGEI